MYVLQQKNMYVTQGLSRLRHILYEAQTTQRSYKGGSTNLDIRETDLKNFEREINRID